LLLWKIQTQSELLITGLLCATGFFVYGPQCLLAIAAPTSPPSGAATRRCLTSIFGYVQHRAFGLGFGICRPTLRLECGICRTDWLCGHRHFAVHHGVAGKGSRLQTMI